MVIPILLLMSGCLPSSSQSALPTRAIAAATVGSEPAANRPSPVPPTWTPVPESIPVSPTSARISSRTPLPTSSPWPTVTQTPTETPTSSATPPPSVTPTFTPIAVSNLNLLPNPSFEDGWYNLNGIPELQVPNQWTLEWDTGDNPLDPDPWNDFVRPESRVLNFDFLPASEHDTFIWDGSHTVKIFKGEGAISFRLFTFVFLQPGNYQFEINIYPDLIVGYTDAGGKIFADDPLSGELQFLVDVPATTWILPHFGQRNTYAHSFTVTNARMVKIGLAVRGRWAIENNGWFMDDWSLRQLPE
ncbi:MAG: hypothetical protein WAM60_15135 [Candidatus Promineifilaceae bacterium]